MTHSLLRSLSLTISLTLLGSAGAAVGEASEGGLRAGAAAIRITPSLDRPVYLAGFKANRRANSVHDDLWARALVLEHDGQRVAFVGLDLIGLSNQRIRAIRGRVRSVPAAHVVIACTHVHSGPDTLGLWGPSALETGRDSQYMTWLEEQVERAVEQAAGALKPASARFATATVPDGLVYNSRDRGIQDKTLTALRLTDEKQQTIATLVNYAGHPEVMQNGSNALTADFCGVTMREVEQSLGGVGVYLNGALGGMVTPEAQKNEWKEVERVGSGIARAAIEALRTAQPSRIDRLRVQSGEVTLPLENVQFRAALAVGLLDLPPQPRIQERGQASAAPPTDQKAGFQPTDAKPPLLPSSLPTEITRIELGDAEFVTVPGELLPKPGLDLRAAMRGRYRFMIGLGQDELGYILDEPDFDRDLYRYERSMSLGKQTWPLLFEALKQLIVSR